MTSVRSECSAFNVCAFFLLLFFFKIISGPVILCEVEKSQKGYRLDDKKRKKTLK